MDTNTTKKAGVLTLVVVAGFLAYLFGNNAEKSEMTEEPDEFAPAAAIKTPVSDTAAPVVAAAYKDGIYSAVGNYVAPSGAEAIDVTLTVKDGMVADATVDATATNPASKQWQATFIAGYKEQVVGKKLSDLSLSKVSGSSLTPKGFNDALNEIRDQAKA